MDIIWDDDDYTDAIMILMEDDSDNEEEDVAEAPMVVHQQHVWGSGSRVGKRPNIERHRVLYSHLLYQDFWGDSPVYDRVYFKRFFKLPIELFDDIVDSLVRHDGYFRQKCDAAGKIGLSPIQKIASAVRQLTSGVSSMEHDDKYRMAASTGLEAMKRFCEGIIAVYSPVALRHPTANDVNRLLDEGKKAGFPGCIGSIDCMHWEWKNCPSAWKGMFQGKSGVATVVLEAIADHNCRFWHFNFGAPGTLNDLNILDRSPLFNNAVRGEAPQVNFVVNNNNYNYAYWLGDGIYPSYACFVKTFHRPVMRMQKLFASAQEAKRKDIERAFGILQARFHVLTTGCRLWDRQAMKLVIKTCVILHNMVIDFECANNLNPDYIDDDVYVPQHAFTIIPHNPDHLCEDRANMILEMQHQEMHNRLQHDLMIDMWAKWNDENGPAADSDEDGGE
jgi:hypothetical protein